MAACSVEARGAVAGEVGDAVDAGGAVETSEVGTEHLLTLVRLNLTPGVLVTRCARAQECVHEIRARSVVETWRRRALVDVD